MMQTKIVKNYTDPIGKVADDFVTRIKFLSNQNPLREMPENFGHELGKWALESLAYMMLDKRIGLFHQNIEAEKYLYDLENFMDLIYEIDVKPNVWRYINTKEWKKYVEVSDSMTR